MIPHFELVQGKSRFLVFRLGEDFHIIDCNEALTKEKRFAVLESGCTPDQMRDMGLSGTTIAKLDLTAITVTGCGPQDDVIFYLGKKKLGYRFAMSYEQKKVDDFFRGIPRKQYKTRYRLKGGRDLDWRLKEQDEAKYQKLRPVGWVYNSLCALIWLIPVVMQKLNLALIGWLVIGLCLVGVALDAVFPVYFSIIVIDGQPSELKWPRKARKKLKSRSINLGYGMLGTLLLFGIACNDQYQVLQEGLLLKMALLPSLVMALLLVFSCREFQEHQEAFALLLLSAVIAVMLNFAAFIPHFNHILGPETESYEPPVVDKYSISGKNTSYYCEVQLPDGQIVRLNVTRAEYERLEMDDTMELQYGAGFFGLEYIIDEIK